MSRKPISRHVVPRAGGGYAVQAPTATRASALVRTQAEGIDRARTIVINAGGGEVRIHGRDGRIRDSDTVGGGNDPRSSKDTR